MYPVPVIVFYIKNLTEVIDKLWIAYICLIMGSVAFFGLLWCLLGFAWVNKIHKRYNEQINKPWEVLIERYKLGEIPFEVYRKQHSFFLHLSVLSLDEYRKASPFYIIKHWNDKYNEKWLEEKTNKEVSNGNNNVR